MFAVALCVYSAGLVLVLAQSSVGAVGFFAFKCAHPLALACPLAVCSIHFCGKSIRAGIPQEGTVHTVTLDNLGTYRTAV